MHLYIMSGTQTGAIDPRTIELDTIHDNSALAFTSYNVTLEYVDRRNLTLDAVFDNSVDLVTYGVTLSLIVVTPLTLTLFDNGAGLTTYDLELALVPFVPVNAETTALFAAYDQTYSTTDKRQVDTLISGFKTAGVWTKFDWYGNAHWAKSEHDALLNWVAPAQTLVKVGTASWTLNVGLSGVAPVISDSRYTSGWQIADGPHATGASFAFFVNITEIPVAMNGLQPIGVWKRDFGGPSTPNGDGILSLSTIAGTGFSGAHVKSGSGDGSFTVGGGGLGVWGVSHSGSAHITVHDGVTVASSSILASADYTDPDGMSVAGSAGAAKRSFAGTELYWGWGSALTALEFAAIEAAYQTSLLPPVVITSALLVDGSDDYLLVDGSDNYLKVV
jgi:hypothetical protein